jgi:hypothetical protein
MKQLFANNYSTTVASTFGSGDTTLNVVSAAGLPALGVDEFIALTIYRQVGVVESGHEVMHVTAIAGTALTVTRSEEGAAASVFVAGDRIQARITAATMASKADAAEVDALTKADVGLGNVDNTSDANKPVSTAQQTALNLKANLATTYSKSETDTLLAAMIDAAPGTLDTLNELAAALGDDPNFATTVTASIALKLPIANPAATGGFSVSSAAAIDSSIDTTTAQNRLIKFKTNASSRWAMGATSTAEGGANAGSNFTLDSYTDAGALLTNVLTIVRSTGVATFAATPVVGTMASGNDSTSAASTAWVRVWGTTAILAQALTGISFATGTAIVATDSILVGMGKAQKQITDLTTTVGTKASLTGVETLTNKRITPRIDTTASSSTPTPTGDASDMYTVTALAANATFAAPSGTPTNGQRLMLRIKDNGTARTLAWNAIYRAGSDVALPTTTTISKTMYVGFFYNSADTKWDLLSVTNGI